MISIGDKAVLDPDVMSNEFDEKNRPLTEEEKKKVDEIFKRHDLRK